MGLGVNPNTVSPQAQFQAGSRYVHALSPVLYQLGADFNQFSTTTNLGCYKKVSRLWLVSG